MQKKGLGYHYCTKRRVGVKPCLLEANPVHCGGLERLGSTSIGLRKTSFCCMIKWSGQPQKWSKSAPHEALYEFQGLRCFSVLQKRVALFSSQSSENIFRLWKVANPYAMNPYAHWVPTGPYPEMHLDTTTTIASFLQAKFSTFSSQKNPWRR